jgi:hypothetical protein
MSRRFQFSLARLMGVVTLVSVGVACLASFSYPKSFGQFFWDACLIGVAEVAFTAAFGIFYAASLRRLAVVGFAAIVPPLLAGLFCAIGAIKF